MVPVVTVLTSSGETQSGEITSLTSSVLYQLNMSLLREMEFGGRGRMVSSVHVSHARVVIIVFVTVTSFIYLYIIIYNFIVIVTVTKGYRTVLLMYKCLILISLYPYNHSLSMTLWYICSSNNW